MTTEQDHLTQLRAAAEAMSDRSGDDGVRDDAIRLLLKVSIAHHERAAASPAEAMIEHPPSFMESGELQTPPMAPRSRQADG